MFEKLVDAYLNSKKLYKVNLKFLCKNYDFPSTNDKNKRSETFK